MQIDMQLKRFNGAESIIACLPRRVIREVKEFDIESPDRQRESRRNLK